MTLEIFFEKFDLFADAPDALAKMREVVLELAVQGRLTSALPSDCKVPSVIEFRESAAALANSLGLRSPKEAVEEAEPPFDVPSHWRWMALADIGAAQTGTTPSKADHDAFNGDIPFIKPADILPSSIDYSNESLTRHGAETGSRLAPSGSLIMVCIGTIGKCNLIERECAFNQQINSLTPVAAVDSRYLLVAARSRSFQDAAWKKSSSTTIAILNKGKWLSIPVPLPPLAEQKRIVAKVDELMALCDRLEAQHQERETRHAALARASLARFADAPTPSNLNYLFHSSFSIPPSSLRKSILTLAVQGKLVPQDPNDEPAENWLQKVTKLEPSTEAEFGEPPYSLPRGWIWLRVASVFEVAGGIQKTPHRTPRNNAFPYLGVGNVYRGRLDLTNVKEFELEPGELERRRLQAGDLLIIEGNGSFNEIGRCAKWNGEIENCVHQNHVIRCRPSDARICDFVLLFLNSPNGMKIMQRLAITSSGLYSLSVGKIRQIEIPLPPLAEQRRIVAKVEQLMALVDALETQLAASRATAANLLSALVAELTNS